MTRRWSSLITALLTALLCSCATGERLEAAGSAHALLVSIRDNDPVAFDEHVDRAALEEALQQKLIQRARQSEAPRLLRGLGALASGQISHYVVADLIRPKVLRGIAELYGYRPGEPVPSRIMIAGALRALPGGRVCAVMPSGKRCVITFANENQTWKLVDFDLDFAARSVQRRVGGML